MNWTEAQRLHSDAAADLASAAAAVPSGKWLVSRAGSKWAPADVIEHLSLSYDVALRELGGGAGMVIRTRWWQRMFLRLTMMRKLLDHGIFPEGAPAPREVRPVRTEQDQATAIARFRELAAAFTAAAAQSESARFTHAYFGTMNARDALLMFARHIQHHQKQLPVS